MEADWKSKVEWGGRARLRSSRCRWLRMLRMSWRCGGGIEGQRAEVPSIMESHSEWAAEGLGGRRWLKRVRMEVWEGGMRRTRRPGGWSVCWCPGL